jgi:hypothetical protein
MRCAWFPSKGKLEIELAGDLAAILALGANSKKPVTGDRDGLQATLVAGTRNHREFIRCIDL